ncbi:reverse transcriptase domain-containing protein [Tanacetum coccineum]
MIDCDVKGVTIRDGKTMTQDVYDNDTNVLPKEPVVVEPEKPVGSNEVLTNDQHQITSEPVVQLSNEVQPPPVPFPRRLRKEKDEAQQKKFLKNLKQHYINFPFIEALAQMPKCSAVLLNKLPSEEKDPGSFTIPCDIGQLHIDNALADLQASISLMPYTMYKKLSLGEPKATRMSLELTDWSIQYLRGIIEKVLIKVDKFVLPIDFVILDMPEDSRVPIILGRPFLETARAKKITLRVEDDEIIFDVDQSTKIPTTKDDECYGIDDLDKTINDEAQELLANKEPDSSNEIDEKKLELKNLPQHLEYAYLHGDKSFPIIVSSELSEKEKISLLQLLDGGNEYYCLLDGFLGFFQITIAPEDQEKITFTCPYGTFAYRRIPFGLCNAPATFQRCMTAIFHDMVEDFMEVFMDDFSVFEHYTTTEKELLTVVFSFDKFRQYLVLSKIVVYTDHSALKYLFSKEDAKPRLIRWVLLLQGFDIEIKDKKRAENLAADHLSRLENLDLGTFTEEEITDEFPDEHLMILKAELNNDEPCFVLKALRRDIGRRCAIGEKMGILLLESVFAFPGSSKTGAWHQYEVHPSE